MLDRRQVVAGLGTLALAALVPKHLWAAAIKPDDSSALLVIDVQNCFLPGGSLAVKDGEQVVPVINKIAKSFANVVMTQDWHTPGHISFASTHSGKKPFEIVDLAYGKQVLWPDHCVQGTDGASLSKDLAIPQAELIIRKGFSQGRRQLLRLHRGRRQDHHRARRLSEGAQRRTGFRGRARYRLLRRMDRARCAQGRLRDLCGGRCLPRHRHPGIARQGLGRHGQGRRQAHPVLGYRVRR
ncbi:hypothetical protein ABIF03_005997 [Bradyrhizobium elkanii]